MKFKGGKSERRGGIVPGGSCPIDHVGQITTGRWRPVVASVVFNYEGYPQLTMVCISVD